MCSLTKCRLINFVLALSPLQHLQTTCDTGTNGVEIAKMCVKSHNIAGVTADTTDALETLGEAVSPALKSGNTGL